jgi:hypothetical protein
LVDVEPVVVTVVTVGVTVICTLYLLVAEAVVVCSVIALVTFAVFLPAPPPQAVPITASYAQV